MSAAELIYQKAKALLGALQTEVLHYVEFLLPCREPKAEALAWARFSASQLELQYCPQDAIYERD